MPRPGVCNNTMIISNGGNILTVLPNKRRKRKKQTNKPQTNKNYSDLKADWYEVPKTDSICNPTFVRLATQSSGKAEESVMCS